MIFFVLFVYFVLFVVWLWMNGESRARIDNCERRIAEPVCRDRHFRESRPRRVPAYRRKSRRVQEIGARPPVAARRHRDCDDAINPKGGYVVFWMLVVVMVGIGLGWVNVRRRRKAVAKVA